MNILSLPQVHSNRSFHFSIYIDVIASLICKTHFFRWFVSVWNSAAWTSFAFWCSLTWAKASWNFSTISPTWQLLVIMQILFCFCIFWIRWYFYFLPLFVGDQMLSSWEGLFFTINTFTAHIFPAVTIWVQIRQHSTNLFHSRCP